MLTETGKSLPPSADKFILSEFPPVIIDIISAIGLTSPVLGMPFG